MRNGRGRSGRDRRSTTIPIDTITKASSVPMLTSAPSVPMGVSPAAIATAAPVAIVEMCGVWKLGCIVPRHEIIDSVWKEAFVTDTSLAEAISFLRQSLGDDPQAPTYIQTVHRRGYRFVAPVVDSSPAAVRPDALTPDAAAVPEPVSPSIGNGLVPWSVAVLCAILAAAALWQYTHFRAPLPPVVRMRSAPAAGTTFDRRAPALAVAPDGTVVTWSACDPACRLYVRRLDVLEGRAVPGTEDA